MVRRVRESFLNEPISISEYRQIRSEVTPKTKMATVHQYRRNARRFRRLERLCKFLISAWEFKTEVLTMCSFLSEMCPRH